MYYILCMYLTLTSYLLLANAYVHSLKNTHTPFDAFHTAQQNIHQPRNDESSPSNIAVTT